MNNPSLVNSSQILSKIENYCAYQERSKYEVKNKLRLWNLTEQDIEDIISHLIQKRFLNEERFAQAYTSEKFRIHNWGKLKIKQGLKLRYIPEELIKKSLQTLDLSDYRNKLKYLIEKKSKTLTEKDIYKRRNKLLQYALTKGFEPEFITEVLST